MALTITFEQRQDGSRDVYVDNELVGTLTQPSDSLQWEFCSAPLPNQDPFCMDGLGANVVVARQAVRDELNRRYDELEAEEFIRERPTDGNIVRTGELRRRMVEISNDWIFPDAVELLDELGAICLELDARLRRGGRLPKLWQDN